MRRVALLVNPAAGRGAGQRLSSDAREQLRRGGLECNLQFTNAPGEMRVLVSAALRDGVDCVAVAGGDGSVNEAVNGYVGVARDDQSFAVIPLGTGNDFAKMLGVGNDWRLACERIIRGETRRVDAGRCNGHVFANGIGAGFDAQVAIEANQIRWLRGNPVYGVALARTLLLRYATPKVRIVHDGGAIETSVTMLAAANGTTYGGAFQIAPGADISDGLLDLMVADRLSRMGIIGFIPHVLRGTHVGRKGVTTLRTRRLVVETDELLVVHADGEIIGMAAKRLEVEVLPGALLAVVD